jgi:hypothetical protein
MRLRAMHTSRSCLMGLTGSCEWDDLRTRRSGRQRDCDQLAPRFRTHDLPISAVLGSCVPPLARKGSTSVIL